MGFGLYHYFVNPNYGGLKYKCKQLLRVKYSVQQWVQMVGEADGIGGGVESEQSVGLGVYLPVLSN